MFRQWLSHASRLQLLLAACAFALLVWLVDTGLDSAMIHFHTSRREVLLLSRAITALLAGAMMLWVLFIQRTRQIETEQRLKVIGEMNHHVRNALQVITYWGVQERNREQLRFIGEAVQRIEWALRDILPRGVPPARTSDYNQRHEMPAAVPDRRR